MPTYNPHDIPILPVTRVSFARRVTSRDVMRAASSDSAPSIANLTPANNQQIQASAAVTFDLRFNTALANAAIYVGYPDQTLEVAYYDGAFRAPYTGSTRSTITDGYHFNLVRTGGWPESPSIEVEAVDVFGSAL
jgi:hypothetical protein